MSARSEIAWIRGGQFTLFSDRCGAYGLVHDLIRKGVQGAWEPPYAYDLAPVEVIEHWGSYSDNEAFLLIDQDCQTVFWSHYHHEFGPRLVQYLAEATWPGWTIVSLPEDFRSVLNRYRGPQGGYSGRPLSDYGDLLWMMNPHEEFAEGTVISVRCEDGQVVTWQAMPEALEYLYGVPPETLVAYAEKLRREFGQVIRVADTWQFEDAGAAWPYGGVLIDAHSKHVRWWTMTLEAGVTWNLRHHWQGWQVECLGDQFEIHEASAGITGLRPTLREQVEADEELAEFLEEARSLPQENGLARAVAALDEMIARGVDQLPAARYLSPEGELIEPA